MLVSFRAKKVLPEPYNRDREQRKYQLLSRQPRRLVDSIFRWNCDVVVLCLLHSYFVRARYLRQKVQRRACHGQLALSVTWGIFKIRPKLSCLTKEARGTKRTDAQYCTSDSPTEAFWNWETAARLLTFCDVKWKCHCPWRRTKQQ